MLGEASELCIPASSGRSKSGKTSHRTVPGANYFASFLKRPGRELRNRASTCTNARRARGSRRCRSESNAKCRRICPGGGREGGEKWVERGKLPRSGNKGFFFFSLRPSDGRATFPERRAAEPSEGRAAERGRAKLGLPTAGSPGSGGAGGGGAARARPEFEARGGGDGLRALTSRRGGEERPPGRGAIVMR